MNNRRALHPIVAFVLAFALVLSPLTPALHAQEGTNVWLPLIGAGITHPSVAVSDVLFRTEITVTDPTRRARLDDLGVTILERDETGATVLVDYEQLADLARLRYEPRNSEEFGALVNAGAEEKPWLARSLRSLGERAQIVRAELGSPVEVMNAEPRSTSAALVSLRTAAQSLTMEQRAALSSLPSLDDDGDGLTNTEEGWWCTDPLNPDSDGDGVSDGAEVAALKDWLGNRRAGPPASGRPFAGWPPATFDPIRPPTCRDGDGDGVPDLAERWDLGLNMNAESTDRDKFDDGQELFGTTEWGRGALPRVTDDAGYIFAEMPTWVKAPGNHPFVAAFPVPEIDVVQSSLKAETVTTVTTDYVISSGTEKSYSTAKMEGTSTSVANTETWSEWQEASESLEERQFDSVRVRQDVASWWDDWKQKRLEAKNYRQAKKVSKDGCTSKTGGRWSLQLFDFGYEFGQKEINSRLTDSRCEGAMREARQIGSERWNKEHPDLTQESVDSNTYVTPEIRFEPVNEINLQNHILLNNNFDTDGIVAGIEGLQYTYAQTGELIADRLYDISYVLAAPVKTTTETRGQSWGGSQTITNEHYEEHTITNGEAFSNGESWGTATAVDSAHAADLRFTYKVRNTGTEYARQIGNLAFNIYIGDDPDPTYTYFVAPDLGGNGIFQNFMPNEEHTYTSRRIPLSLEQMKAIDLGGPLRIVVEDFTYGIDELFYQDAANAGVLIAIEDGMDDGNEAIDSYLISTWGEETVLDVLARYFPHTVDENGMMIAIWTPEYRSDTPAWCAEPRVVGSGGQRTIWCKQALSTADWWNVYTNGMGDGSEGFQDTPASPGATALFRFNKDSDLDGYSDRSEERLGTDPFDASDYPRPELLAGLHSIRGGNYVTATLSLLNTGLYDAYGVEAVMIAPDDSVSITNNTVGGSGRVRAQKQVIVGSRIAVQTPLPAAWLQANHAQPSPGGYYTGNIDRTYSFTVQCANPGGCDVGSGTWTLVWNDGAGASSSLNFGDGYKSPTLLNVGAFGLKLGMLSGKVNNGESFTVDARTPRDTFQYTINREPYTKPLIIVSYNDPQGNHRFIVPPSTAALSTPSDNLAPFSGQMLDDVGVEIVTTEAYTGGTTSTRLLVNNPSETTITGANVFLEFINISGTVVSEVSTQVTLPPGPTTAEIAWDSTAFDPAYSADEDYIVMAFLTDYQGNILDTAGRPLSSFQDDPRAAASMDASAQIWDFGTAQQGTFLQHQFALASVGYMDLLTYLGNAPGLSVSGPGASSILPGDVAIYTVQLNTENLPVGEYETTIPVRTSDAQNPSASLTIRGNITPMPCDGWVGEYFSNMTLTGSPQITRCDGLLDFQWGSGSPDPAIPADKFSVRWTKQFQVYTDGTYTFDVRSDDGVRVYVDDELVVDYWSDHDFWFATGTKSLTAGEHTLRVEYYENMSGAAIRLVYGPSGTRMHPLDWSATFNSGTQGQWVDFTHTLGPEPQTLHPVKVYSQNYGTLHGVGKYATDFGAGTASAEMFGDGRDGAMPGSGNLDNNNGFGAGTVNGSAGSTSIAVVDRYAVWRIKTGDVVLIHQTRGSGAGQWELNKAISNFTGSGTFTLATPLKYNYVSNSGNEKAQILRVPQYSTCNVTGTVTPLAAWNGEWGGIFAVMCNGTLSIAGGAKIDIASYGFRGGVGQGVNLGGQNGESTDGFVGRGGTSNGGFGTYGGGSGANNGSRSPSGLRSGGAGSGGYDYANSGQGDEGTGGGGGGGNATAGGGGGGGGDSNTEGRYGGSAGTTAGGGNGGDQSVTGGNGGNNPRGYTGSGGNSNGSSNRGTGGGGGGSALGDNSVLLFGSGGGASGAYQGLNAGHHIGRNGGNGGGIGIISALSIQVAGTISAIGQSGQTTNGRAGSGGGGAGGSLLLRMRDASIGSNLIQAYGGSGGPPSGAAGGGGQGGAGRILIDYCESVIGLTNPTASTQKLTCHITEQVETAPYNSARLNLPASFIGGRTYQVQYGRRLSFASASTQTTTIRLPKQLYSNATLQALVSNTGVASGAFNLALDFGNNNSTEWTHSATTAFPATLNVTGAAAGLNAYLVSRTDVAWGAQIDVPVRVVSDRAATVMLTNLTLTPVGAKTRTVRLEARTFSTATLGLEFRQPGVASGPLAFTVDVGADGTVDWSYAGTPNFPARLTSPNLTAAINAYLDGHSGVVDVPIRITPSPSLDLALIALSASPTDQPDLVPLAPSASQTRSVSSIVEGDIAHLTSVIQNNGARDSGPIAVTFFATRPSPLASYYIGSIFIPNVPTNGSAPASIQWNTLGFTGPVTVTAMVDPFNRVAESNKSNNNTVAPITILTRPDLAFNSITLSNPEPMAGETVTLTVSLKNEGQTAASAHRLALYRDNPDGGGTQIRVQNVSTLNGGASRAIALPWTPTTPGLYRLFLRADRDGQVNESDRSNNDRWLDVHVGFDRSIALNSGGGGEPAYSAQGGFGVVDEGKADVLGQCGSEPHQTYRQDTDGRLRYRFDHLLPGHFYHLDVTLYNCPGQAQRLQSILVDGELITAQPIDLGDGTVHRLSFLLDPAFYADRSIDVAITADGINGAVVNEIKLHDVDYRYADAGGVNDPQYPGTKGYGWLDGTDNTAWGRLPIQSVRTNQLGKELRYRFDGLKPDKRYNVHLAFWQGGGSTPTPLKIQIDGIDSGSTFNLITGERQDKKIAVLPIHYQSDGSIVVSVVRPDVNGPFVNEIALEEETVAASATCVVRPTTSFMQVFGSVIIEGIAAQTGTVVQAINPRGDTVGCFTVTDSGLYGDMFVYAEDATAIPPIPGMRDGELVVFRVNGAQAVASPAIYWREGAVLETTLDAGPVDGQSILLSPDWNFFSLAVESAAPLVGQILSSVDGRYDRVVAEEGVYLPNRNPIYNTLKELHCGPSYLVRVTGGTTANLLVEGRPCAADAPTQLHQGWNWIGYPLAVSLPITTALQSVDGRYQRVINLTQSYDPARPAFSTLKQFDPNKGYMIYMNETATLIYPTAGAASLPAVERPVSALCGGVRPTPNATLLYGALHIDGEAAPTGTQVELLTPAGEVAGCFMVEEPGLYGMVFAYGADGEATPPIPGFGEGEEITVRVNGILAESAEVILWQDDKAPHQLDLSVTSQPTLYLPLLGGKGE